MKAHRLGCIHVTRKFGISGTHHLACRGRKRTICPKTDARALHVHNAPQPPNSYGAK